MKKTFIVMLLSAVAIQAQNNELICKTGNQNADYFDSIDSNKVWSTLYYGFGSGLVITGVFTVQHYISGDSIVNNKVYKKIFSSRDSLRLNVQYVGLIREENSKAFYIPKMPDYHFPDPNVEDEYLFYDFSLEEGRVYKYKMAISGVVIERLYFVKAVDSIEINGVLKKRIQFNFPAPDYIPDSENPILETWIEGVGSLTGFVYPFYNTIISGGVSFLLCCTQDEELIYRNPDYQKCYYDKVEELTSVPFVEKNDDLLIIPNYVDDVLSISLPQDIAFVEIYDTTGKRMLHSTFAKETNIRLNVAFLARGIYLVKVYGRDNKAFNSKIIKK